MFFEKSIAVCGRAGIIGVLRFANLGICTYWIWAGGTGLVGGGGLRTGNSI